ncbi:MAG: fasciclin domain-containing protein [Alphaproteobacteria bacterium]|nr:fasciclin domain-containing protein [Alphaproteobacteria bacterium]
MKHFIYGIAGVLAIGTAIPAFAMPTHNGTAPSAAHKHQAGVVETATSRTVVVSETQLFGQQIAGQLEGVDKATMFRQLMENNGLSASLRDKSKGYTAFVPVDKAFQGMTLPSAAPGKINPEVRGILEDHVVSEKFDVNLLHGQRDNVKSLSGKNIVVSKAGKSYFANGHLIVDRMHSPEGIVYFIEDVISSPDITAAIYNPSDVKK